MYVYIGKKNDIGRIVRLIRNHGISALLDEQSIEIKPKHKLKEYDI